MPEPSNHNFLPPDEIEFRSRIKKYHQKNKSAAYKVLDERPNLNTLIEFRLAKTNLLINRARGVREIIEFCKREYDLTFKSAAMSQALKNAVDAGISKRVQKDKRNFLYQAIGTRKDY